METGDLLAFRFAAGDDMMAYDSVPFNELILFNFFANPIRVWMKVVDGAQDVETLNSDCNKTRLIVEKMNGRLHCIYLILC